MKQIVDILWTVSWAIKNAFKTKNYKEMINFMILKLVEARDILSQEPDRPDNSKPIDSSYTVPDFIEVKGVKFNTHGKYRTRSGNAKGLVVHYTVSGRSENSAIGVLKYLARKGLGCMVMDEDGFIYVPEGFDIQKDVAWHAGKSSWMGKTSISKYCMGMEICCWGRLDSKSKKKVKSSDKRVVSRQNENIKVGEYQKYTKDQEKSLFNFIKWQMSVNPEFSLDWLVGHDEIAPTRKQDPGASLSMTMPKLREKMSRL